MGPRTPAAVRCAGFVHLMAQLGQNWSALLTFSSNSTLMVTSPGRLVSTFLFAHLRNLRMCSSKLLGDLLFHLFRRGAGIRRSTKTLADRNAGILGSGHRQKRMDPYRHVIAARMAVTTDSAERL